MTKELFEKIYQSRLINTGGSLTWETFSKLLESHPEGFKKVLDLWDIDNKEVRFGENELSETEYYHVLAQAGIITHKQLYRLNGQLDTRDKYVEE